MDTGNSPKVKRIAIVGPECTGKTDLARFLAQHYRTQWVPEFARTYVDALPRPYTKDDLIIIANGQLSLEDELAEDANQLLFCDTNLIVIKIWSEFKYGNSDPEIIQKMTERHYDLHLLMDIDLPWQDDPQREHPHKRKELFELYESELVNNNFSYIKISGEDQARREAAIHAVEKIMDSKK